jgi:hypothetical protein
MRVRDVGQEVRVEGNEEGAVLLVNSGCGCVEGTPRRQEPDGAGPLFEIILELGKLKSVRMYASLWCAFPMAALPRPFKLDKARVYHSLGTTRTHHRALVAWDKAKGEPVPAEQWVERSRATEPWA